MCRYKYVSFSPCSRAFAFDLRLTSFSPFIELLSVLTCCDFVSLLCVAYLKIIERGEWAVSGLAQPNSNSGAFQMLNMGSGAVGSGSNPMDTIRGALDVSSSGGTVTSAALGKIGAMNASTRGPGVGDGGDKVLMKCVRLLKTYLLVYYPSDPVLLALDRFCYKMQGIFEEASKSFEYIRTLVGAISQSRHNPDLTILHLSPSIASPLQGHSGMMSTGSAGVLSGASSNPQLNHHHFNTAPSSVIALGLSSAAPSSTSSVGGTAGGSSVAPGPVSGSIPGLSSKSSSLSTSEPPSPGHSRNETSPTVYLIPNMIASRVRPVSHYDALDSLLCSTIFGGRTPKQLLDLFAENSDRFSKYGTTRSGGSAPNLSLPASSSPSSPSLSSSQHYSSSTATTPRSPSARSSLGMMDLQATARPVLKNLPLSAVKPQHNHATKAFLLSLHDQDLGERIRTVSLSKKAEERAMFRSFRRGQPLFQYRHYSEQLKLDLTSAQIDSIVDAMIQSTNHESRMLASKIVIKLIMDMYCNDPIEVASASLLSLLLELMQRDQPIDTKIHAFNLIFNLSTHLNMFEDVSFFASFSSSSNATSSSSSSSSSSAATAASSSSSAAAAAAAAAAANANPSSTNNNMASSNANVGSNPGHGQASSSSSTAAQTSPNAAAPMTPNANSSNTNNATSTASPSAANNATASMQSPKETPPGTTPTIQRIQNELFSIFKELLLILVQTHENNRKIWFSGLSCLLYFMADTGHISKEKYVKQGSGQRFIPVPPSPTFPFLCNPQPCYFGYEDAQFHKEQISELATGHSDTSLCGCSVTGMTDSQIRTRPPLLPWYSSALFMTPSPCGQDED